MKSVSQKLRRWVLEHQPLVDKVASVVLNPMGRNDLGVVDFKKRFQQCVSYGCGQHPGMCRTIFLPETPLSSNP
jgi:hypothetical protein